MLNVLMNCNEIAALSFPIHLLCNETTSGGGLTQFTFNSNWLNLNSMWMQLIYALFLLRRQAYSTYI